MFDFYRIGTTLPTLFAQMIDSCRTDNRTSPRATDTFDGLISTVGAVGAAT